MGVKRVSKTRVKRVSKTRVKRVSEMGIKRVSEMGKIFVLKTGIFAISATPTARLGTKRDSRFWPSTWIWHCCYNDIAASLHLADALKSCIEVMH